MDKALFGGLDEVLADSANVLDGVVFSFVDIFNRMVELIKGNSKITHLIFWCNHCDCT